MRKKSGLMYMLGFAALVLIAAGVFEVLKNRGDIQRSKDAIYDDLSNISAHAYMYRVQSGRTNQERSYAGYTIPEKMRSNEYGDYFAEVVSADTLKLIGRSRTSPREYHYGLSRQGWEKFTSNLYRRFQVGV